MTTTAPTFHMYAQTAIRFTDPFGPKDSLPSQASRIDLHFPPFSDFNRALTPPPEMNGGAVTQASRPGYHAHEHAHHYGDSLPPYHASRAATGPYVPQEVANTDFGRNGVSTQPASRTMSPAFTSRQNTVDESHLQPPQRSASQAPSIAPSFQIPKTVNDSGGSLAELAAQITCLFWFESSDLLQEIEESPIPLLPRRPLASDARPTAGFRKWVTTILTTTMVAQNVVLLALLFIHRLKKINSSVRGKPGSEYRLLTVALMLGNKFLDDNTYTNKTWAEVSGINVNEVHIMEVEFLSNMKYCLFTTADDWAKWQTLLGKFANFFERASVPQRPNPPAPILPPASSLHLPMAFPSPPASNQASPPYLTDHAQHPSPFGGHFGLTPAPSPLTYIPNGNMAGQNMRKRSHDDDTNEPSAKRAASNYQTFQSPHHYASAAQPPQRPPFPALPNPIQHVGGTGSQVAQSQQLPPLNMPARAMAMVYPNPSSSAQLQHIPALASSQPASQFQSRQQSPYTATGSATASPSRGLPPSTVTLQPSIQVSPTHFLHHRNSPYRPVHHVSTLLYPPTTAALQNQPQTMAYSQMHYQPLGKTVQQAESGRLPYVSQNVWLDGNQQQSMTPVFQWPGFGGLGHGQMVPHQQLQRQQDVVTQQ